MIRARAQLPCTEHPSLPPVLYLWCVIIQPILHRNVSYLLRSFMGSPCTLEDLEVGKARWPLLLAWVTANPLVMQPSDPPRW